MMYMQTTRITMKITRKSNSAINSDSSNNGDIGKNGNKVPKMIVAIKKLQKWIFRYNKYVLKNNPSVMINKA